MAVESLARVAGAGLVLRLIREGSASTRGELVSTTGLARSTISHRVDALLSRRLLVANDEAASTGGRPAQLLSFNRGAGLVLAAELGASHARVAVVDLGGAILADEAHDIDIADGPEAITAWLDERFRHLVRETGRDLGSVLGIGVGLPGPVEYASGVPIAPPIMPGWDELSVAERLRDRVGAPVLVDNDANLMALGERRTAWPGSEHLLYVTVGTGIGAGMISHGRVLHGAQGAAGEIGHVRLRDHDDVRCRCGNRGCLEAVAGGGALAQTLRERGRAVSDVRDVVRLFRAGDPEAAALIREAGRRLGEVLAASINAFNPGVIVIGGDLAEADEPLLAGVREVVYQRAVPLGTRSLRIVPSSLDATAGVVGAAIMAIEHILEPASVDRLLAAHA
jgi:predicted NBD/HSP70 family sugar kinase